MATLMPTSRAPWLCAVAAYHAAEAALNSHPYCSVSPGAANYEELALDHATYLQNTTASLKALLATPSPDAEALAEKFTIYGKEFGSDEELTAVVADARRFLLSGRDASPILAMHKRYEEAAADYIAAEKAESEANKAGNQDDAFTINQSMRVISREQDALRIAILHQVPASWVEAVVLQFHILCLSDMTVGAERADADGEDEALILAVETLFDFMCCEVDQDHGEIGDAFQTEANRVFFRRRRRTGVVGD